MKELNPTIGIGKDQDLEVSRGISVDGETLWQEKGDSVLGQLLVAIFMGMTKPQNSTDHRVRGFDDNQNTTTVSSINNPSGGPFEINLNDDRLYLDNGGGTDNLFYMDSEFSEVTGLFQHDPTDNNSTPITIKLYNPTFNDNGTVAGQSAVDLSGTDMSNLVGQTLAFRPCQSWQFNRNSAPYCSKARVRLGRNTESNTILNPQGVSGMEHLFSIAGRAINNVQTLDHEATIEVSADFTNNQGRDITIEEIALMVEAPNSNEEFVLARDLNQIVISDASTANIFYQITASNNGGSGGLMVHFMTMLRREFLDGNNQTVDRIDAGSTNGDIFDGNWQWFALGPGGNGGLRTGGFGGKDFGPVVGTNNNQVNNSQVSLAGRIDHGTGADELIHHGTYAREPMLRDATNNKYSFDLVRVFENRSGSSIDINETGLYFNTGTSQYGPNGPSMMARHQLSSSVTVANDEVLKLTYTFEINV